MQRRLEPNRRFNSSTPSRVPTLCHATCSVRSKTPIACLCWADWPGWAYERDALGAPEKRASGLKAQAGIGYTRGFVRLGLLSARASLAVVDAYVVA